MSSPPNTEHALVAFARGAGAWILCAAGEQLNLEIDRYGRDADEVGLLRCLDGLPERPQGLLVWEGVPSPLGFRNHEGVTYSYTQGEWRELTVAEWVQVRGGDLALWPDGPPHFVEPRS